jgi:hypothetical protein
MDNKPSTGLTATLDAAQWDRIGTMLMGQLNQHKAETAAIEPIVASLRSQLQAKPAVATNGMRSVPPSRDMEEVIPEPDVEVPSTA